MYIDRESIPKKVVLEFVIVHSEDDKNRVELEELEKIQSTTKHGATLMSLYAT